MKSITLLGIKHCGKSTQGKLLAKKLVIPFYDTDDLITQRTGLTPRELYIRNGERAFMDAEAQTCTYLHSLLQEKNEHAVIATGGGICKNADAIATLKTMSVLVFLKAEESTAAERIMREVTVSADGSLKNLPAYIAKKNPHTKDDVRMIFHEFYIERTRQYEKIASICIRMEPVSKQENLQRIYSELKRSAAI